MKTASIALALALLLSLVGCGAHRPATEDGLLDYDLGESTVLDGSGREVSYKVQGLLGIPEEKNCPVVVLLHGSHPIEKASEAPYYKGFAYLAQSLSQRGNLVISMNVAINYSFENGEPNGNERTRQVLVRQLELLQKAVKGDKSVFGRDVTGAGDFHKIILVGHSRGGLDVLEFASAMPQGMRAVGVVCVAPAEYKVMEFTPPDVPIGILLPQMDGDVVSMDGSSMYEGLLSLENRRSQAELVYLKQANHAYFNTQLTAPDLNHSPEDVEQLMAPERQRAFLTGYLGDFVRNAVKDGRGVFSSAETLGSRAYDCDVLLRVHSGVSAALWSAESDEAPGCTGAATQRKENFSVLPGQNTVERFRMPDLHYETYSLHHVLWDAAGSGVTLPVSADLSGSGFVDIDMAVDSTDERNRNGQTMTVTFMDALGNAASFAVGSDAAALLWQEGVLTETVGWEGEPVLEYSTYTPLVTLRVPLGGLSGVDLTRITGLALSWDNSGGGSVMLRSACAGV